MNNRFRYLVHSVTALALGGIIYLLLRDRTHIHDILHMPAMLYRLHFVGDGFVRYTLPDFLWAYSFASALHALFCGRRRKFVFAAVVLSGAVYEFAQMLSLISGTGDVLDIIMYVLAAVIADYIFFKKKENKK